MCANCRRCCFLEHCLLFFPVLAPRVKVVTLTISRRVLPFRLGRKAVRNAVALRAPTGKRISIFERYIHHGPRLLAKGRLCAIPMTRRSMVGLPDKLSVFRVGDFSLINEERLNADVVRWYFLRRTVV